MNTVNMILNSLKMDKPKADNNGSKTKSESGFNGILEKTIEHSKKTKDTNKTLVNQNYEASKAEKYDKVSQEKNNEIDSLKKLEKEIREYLSKDKSSTDNSNVDYENIMQLLSYLSLIMKDDGNIGSILNGSINETHIIDMDKLNMNNLEATLKIIDMISEGKEITSTLNDLETGDKGLLLMIKLMTATDVEDIEQYLKENFNMSSEEVESIIKFLEVNEILEKIIKMPKEKESITASMKEIFEGITKKLEATEASDTNLSTLVDENGEEAMEDATKEEAVLKNILNGSGGVKNFSIRDIALSQTNKVSEQPVVNKANCAEDLIKSIKYMDVNNLKELTVKVVPKELGELVIKLTIESGIMKANLNATNKEAYELLSANFKDISDKLQNNNIKIGEVNINLYEDDTTFFSDDSRKGSFNQEKENKRPYKFQNEEEYTKEKESVDKNYLSYFV